MKGVLYFDGACLPVNPGGIATYGFVIITPSGEIVKEKGIAAEKGTNNIAEYTALIRGLEKALELGIDELIVRGDSQLAIYQMNGVYAVKSPNIIPLWQRAMELAGKFRKIRFEWVPREQNSAADELSTQAYIEHAERKSRERSEEIENWEIKHVSGPVYRVRRYDVNVEEKTCTCPHYYNVNRFKLLKKAGIKIRCKHIFAAERYRQNRT
ncbi:ribonuclease H [Ferroglobus placidus DSM 10642]|uniref:Ribonuclease H n=1 Tax=Ferroglobus placidus (strain DSM 10642 / AEDII12DO) TaxID=589924 RepID=D3S3A7_FERPA|nr:ribonuclease HI [Ferroglobus placidus]ADC64740.1 ribonuclease H [Ferroglobus placidus DSM 10642]